MIEARPARPPRAVPGSRVWVAAQWVTVAATLALLLGLVRWPGRTLDVLWYAIVPVLPATFLLSTQIWRNVCPVATLNALSGDRIGSRRLAGPWLNAAAVTGIVLLAAMVPARHFLFNLDGTALAITIALVAALAVGGGFWFDKKAAFCNGICPVLPVERLYGQRPLIAIANPRCAPCRRCTMGACLDLVPGRAALSLLGDRREDFRWTRTPFGVFALAFPGFVIGYSLVPDSPMASALAVYGTVLAWAAASWVVLVATFVVTKMEAESGLLWCAGLAAGLYYWFTPAAIASVFGLGTGSVVVLRSGALLLVAVWLFRAVRPTLVRPVSVQ